MSQFPQAAHLGPSPVKNPGYVIECEHEARGLLRYVGLLAAYKPLDYPQAVSFQNRIN